MSEEQKSGVERAIEAAAPGKSTIEGARALAALFNCEVQFIYQCRRKGWFPIPRAQQVAETYGIPLADLVKAEVRAALNANAQ